MATVPRQDFTYVYTYEQLEPRAAPYRVRSAWSYQPILNKSGVKTPKAKWRPPTYYSVNGRTAKSQLTVNLLMERDFDSKTGAPSIRVTHFGAFPTSAPPTWFLAVDPSIREGLFNNCLEKMVDSKFNLLTSIVEFRKTAEHLANTASRITAAVRHVKRGRFRLAAAELAIVKPPGASRSKTWAENWLEYKYGWMPLILDAHGIALHLATMLDEESPILGTRSRFENVSSKSTGGTTDLNTFRCSWTARERLEVRYQATLYYRTEYLSLLNLQRLGLLDPGATAWEAVPFSFVADWFAPIGEWLSLMNAWQGLRFAGGCYTTTQKATVKTHLDGAISIINPVPAKFFAEQITPGLFESYSMLRLPLQDMPTYTLRVKSPVSLDHAITAVALLRTQFK